MSKTTTRQALERIRRALLALDDPVVGPLLEDEVTINFPNLDNPNKKCVTLSCTGFPLKRRNEKQDKRFITVEYRQAMLISVATGFYEPSVDDILDSAYSLADAMTRNDLLGVTLEPDQDAFEGADPKYDETYMVSWRFLAIL